MNERIAELVREKKIEGISDIRDESNSEGIRVSIDLRRNIEPETVKRQLYKYTSIESSFGFNSLAIVENKPKTLGLKDFSPESQDLAALFEADRRMRGFGGGKDLGGLSYLRYHDFDKDTMDNLAGAWASFPNFEGKSYYNQPAKSHDQLIRSYLGEDEYNYRNSAEAKAKAEAWKNMSDDEKLKFAGPLPAIP